MNAEPSGEVGQRHPALPSSTTSPVLNGLQVVDFTQGMAGGLITMMLADNGADVLKIEPPQGDWARGKPAFLMWNRGKRSAVLNLKEREAREHARELALRADVVVTSFRPGVMERLGLDYGAIADLNPGAIYCSVSGFGPLKQFADVKGYEGVVAARLGRMTGLDETEGAAQGQSLDRPIFLSVPLNSYAAAQLAVQGICAALLQRGDSGLGDHVMTSLLQGAAATVMHQQMSKHSRRRDRPADMRYRGRKLTFLTAECKDGRFIQMCARMDQHFSNWMLALDLGDVLSDPRYATAPLGIESLEDLEALEHRIRQRMRTRTQGEWMRIFIEDFDVGADPFLTPVEFLRHPQLIANDCVVELDDPRVGRVRQLGALVAFSETPAQILRSAPALGEHTEVAISDLQAPRKGLRSHPAPARRAMRQAPLTGVTILELAYFLAAPMASTLLAELGARVIKVEPLTGDPWRRMGLEGAHTFHGKESIAMDLKAPASRRILGDLIRLSDILLTNFRPGVSHKLGFDYDAARLINDQLIYVNAGSYGPRGPQAHRPAFHSTPNALGGGGILQAGAGNAPVDDGFPDPAAALGVGTAMALGLLARKKTGRGQFLETSMLVSAGYALSENLVLYEGSPEWRLPDRGQHGPHPLYRLYECATGWLFLAALRDDEWLRLAQSLGRTAWTEDPLFSTAAAREANAEALASEIARTLMADPATVWEAKLVAAGVGAAVADESDLAGFLIRFGLVDAAEHPKLGEYWRIQPRMRFAHSGVNSGSFSDVGEQSIAILQELGCSSSEIGILLESGVVLQASH